MYDSSQTQQGDVQYNSVIKVTCREQIKLSEKLIFFAATACDVTMDTYTWRIMKCYTVVSKQRQYSLQICNKTMVKDSVSEWKKRRCGNVLALNLVYQEKGFDASPP